MPFERVTAAFLSAPPPHARFTVTFGALKVCLVRQGVQQAQTRVLLCRSTIRNLMLGEAYRLLSQERVRDPVSGWLFPSPPTRCDIASKLLLCLVDGMPSHLSPSEQLALVGRLRGNFCCDPTAVPLWVALHVHAEPRLADVLVY